MKSDGKHLQSELDRIISQRPAKVNWLKQKFTRCDTET
jgi:hypothetical protein